MARYQRWHQLSHRMIYKSPVSRFITAMPNSATTPTMMSAPRMIATHADLMADLPLRDRVLWSSRKSCLTFNPMTTARTGTTRKRSPCMTRPIGSLDGNSPGSSKRMNQTGVSKAEHRRSKHLQWPGFSTRLKG
jgi:hypothetical protein